MQFVGNINSALSAYLSDWFCHAWDYITGQYKLVLHSESEYVNGYSEDDIEALRKAGLSEEDIAEIVGIGVEKDNASVVQYTASGELSQPTSSEQPVRGDSVVIPDNPDEKTRIDYELTYYVNDVNTENTQVLMEYGKRDELKSVYTYGNERISAETIADTYNAVTDDFETDYYLYDGRGSVAQVISGDEIVESYTYDPFGNVTSGAPDFDSFYGYNAEDTNPVTGLQYLRFRYYDTEDGRFNVLDTYLGDVSEPLTLNRYAYTANNPVMKIDPSGHFILTALVVGAVIGAGIGAVSSGVKSYKNQKDNGGKVDGWTVAKDALVGGVVGGLVGAAAGVVGAAAAAAVTAVAGTGLAATIVAGAVGGVAGGIVSRGTNTILSGAASNIIQKNNLYKSAVYTQQKTPEQILDEAVGNAFDVKAMISDAMLGAAFAGGAYGVKNLVSKLRAVRQHSCGSAPELGVQNPLDDVTPKIPNVIDDATNNVDDALNSLDDSKSVVDEAINNTEAVDVELKYKEGWNDIQKAEADAKLKVLSESKTVKTKVERGGTSASSRYKSANGTESVPKGYDVDHTIDLQLGGADDISNMNPLDMSVNRSLGAQINNIIKNYPDGTVFGNFTIK